MGFFVDMAKSRTERGKDWLLAFIGPKRSGKSWGALRFAEDICPRFNKDTAETYICFTASQFIKLLNSGQVKSGDVVIIDEAGTSISAREYWEKANRIILGVLQTFGYLHLTVIFTVPYITYIDPDSRKLINAQFEFTEEDNRGVEKFLPTHPHYHCRCAVPHKLKVIRSGKMAGKTFYIMFRDHDGVCVRHAWFHAPSPEVAAIYERLSEAYKDKVIEEAGDAFDTMESEKRSDMPPEIIVSKILRLPENEKAVFFGVPKNRQRTPRVKLNEIEARFNVGERTATKVRTLLRETLKKDAKAHL